MNTTTAPKRCFWCGRLRYLLPINMHEEGVCGACSEDDGYLNHVARIERNQRIEARRKGQKKGE